MSEDLYFPKKIFVTDECKGSALTDKILHSAGHIPVEFIPHSRELIEEVRLARDPVGEGKKLMLITPMRGEYVKPCPCTPNYIGCNYFIINADINCPLDCSYCILQLYLDNPLITVHADTAVLYRQLDEFLHKNRQRTFRIGTGELGDSLALDHLTGRSTELISYFAKRPNALFELKTKTANTDNILAHNPADNIVIAWSLNSQKIAGEEEFGAPSVRERILAASRVSQAGYRVGFHFDPIIHYEGWENDYSELIDGLMTRIDRKKIAWISLGALRFPPPLKPVIQKRFPQTKIIYDEFILGRDGKVRYPKALRLHLFSRIVRDLEKTGGGEVPVYFCMESRDIWGLVQKKAPRNKKEVEKLLTLSLGACIDDF